jgi:hypothetical protein
MDCAPERREADLAAVVPVHCNAAHVHRAGIATWATQTQSAAALPGAAAGAVPGGLILGQTRFCRSADDLARPALARNDQTASKSAPSDRRTDRRIHARGEIFSKHRAIDHLQSRRYIRRRGKRCFEQPMLGSPLCGPLHQSHQITRRQHLRHLPEHFRLEVEAGDGLGGRDLELELEGEAGLVAFIRGGKR